jgi:hypothetical protein
VAEARSNDDEELRARRVGFFDVNASNFLIAYVRDRPHIEDMENQQTTVSTERITKQGVRDLNYYGPRRAKEVAEAPPAATVAETETGVEAGPPATSGPPDEEGAPGQ